MGEAKNIYFTCLNCQFFNGFPRHLPTVNFNRQLLYLAAWRCDLASLASFNYGCFQWTTLGSHRGRCTWARSTNHQRRWREPFPRWYHGLPATRHLSWARFGRLVLILHLYHNYTSCIASSSLDYVWLTCQHVINSFVRICFRRLRVLDTTVPVHGMDISTLPAAVFLWSTFICITVRRLLAISSDNSRVFTLIIPVSSRWRFLYCPYRSFFRVTFVVAVFLWCVNLLISQDDSSNESRLFHPTVNLVFDNSRFVWLTWLTLVLFVWLT